MKKQILTVIMTLAFVITFYGQHEKNIRLNKKYSDIRLSKTDSLQIKFSLVKDNYYSIIAESQGIYLTVDLRDSKGKLLDSDYSPEFGNPAKFLFSPDFTGDFSLMVKRKDKKGNPIESNFSLIIDTAPNKLEKYSLSKLKEDFLILKNAYIETQVGLWYNSYSELDSICNLQEKKIKDNMNALDLYRILAPIVDFTKEGHCYIDLSDKIKNYNKQNGKYFPFKTKIINGKVYILNDWDGFKTKGLEIKKINGHDISEIMNKFLSIEPADGYNITSKYHWIESSFSKYYLRFFQIEPKSFQMELYNPITNKKNIYSNIPSCNFKEFNTLNKIDPNGGYKKASTFTMDTIKSIAILTVNSFRESKYESGIEGFQDYLDKTFKTIFAENIQNLIIDIRKNEGGLQGMEDYLISHLINRAYTKYKYVEIPSFTYTFLKYTDYKNEADILKKELKEDFYLGKDGRYLNKERHYAGVSPKLNNFKGKIYILINGLTFSGGSEFAALAKNYTNATFIGEETGGGFYGNTSGSFIRFKLPNTGLTGRIPLCKFVVNNKDFGIPFGHGVIPNYQIQPTITQYLNRFDTELEYTMSLIINKR